ncbi:MAG TPA: hypothetical protein VN228_00335 [Pyrinomonadaceae bacterium]|nr:hypothetical protein [Pyrinomonadaceae bacterium]
MKILSLTLCLLMSVSAAAARAGGAATSHAAAPAGETFTHEEGGIQFTAPDGWKSEVEGEQLTVSPPGGGIGIVFWVPEGDTFDAAVDALGDELEKVVKDPKLDDDSNKQGTHNGMPHASFSGSGTVNGENMAFSVDLLMAKKPVIVLTFASPENFKKYEADYVGLVSSIKKVG